MVALVNAKQPSLGLATSFTGKVDWALSLAAEKTTTESSNKKLVFFIFNNFGKQYYQR
jgi:hypothetical protein